MTAATIVPVEETITLPLSIEEAELIAALLLHIDGKEGQIQWSAKKSIQQAFEDGGIVPNDNGLQGTVQCTQ